jgi:hypothetical protein
VSRNPYHSSSSPLPRQSFPRDPETIFVYGGVIMIVRKNKTIAYCTFREAPPWSSSSCDARPPSSISAVCPLSPKSVPQTCEAVRTMGFASPGVLHKSREHQALYWKASLFPSPSTSSYDQRAPANVSPQQHQSLDKNPTANNSD